MDWRSRLPISAAAVLLVLATAGVTYFAFGRSGSSNPTAAEAAAQSTTSGAVPPDVLGAVNDLASRDLGVVRQALVTSIRSSLGADGLVPTGTQLDVLPDSWIFDQGMGSLAVDVTLPGQTPRRTFFFFGQEEGRWVLLFTVPE